MVVVVVVDACNNVLKCSYIPRNLNFHRVANHQNVNVSGTFYYYL